MFEVAILPVLADSCIGAKGISVPGPGKNFLLLRAIEGLTTKRINILFCENSSEFSPRPGNCDLQNGSNPCCSFIICKNGKGNLLCFILCIFR